MKNHILYLMCQANETGQTNLVQSGMGAIGLGRVHLADCKRISCHQCHAADGQFASDFQSGAKPFRSFGSPSTIRQQAAFDVLQMAVAAILPLHPERPVSYSQAAFTLA
ncbi:hypothetical protein H920_18813 [Fukomys damarensis]|uniref:Uncharacterized protein n=1 Tax=Fukomys damarensis TaxID=885580 RepID=A0A091CLZ9_FUKDA|nr:hypothetical protein H920_18813 [Fukomys damarensis]